MLLAVTMSVVKLLSRIVAPSDLDFESSTARNQTLHDHTYGKKHTSSSTTTRGDVLFFELLALNAMAYRFAFFPPHSPRFLSPLLVLVGITSDPLTQFACVLSALIHDVDHTGVPNTQLVKENPEFAKMYKDRSVAEQNSVDVAWDLLFDDCYSDLRATIYTTDDDLQRFRQLVVNSVMVRGIALCASCESTRTRYWEHHSHISSLFSTWSGNGYHGQGVERVAKWALAKGLFRESLQCRGRPHDGQQKGDNCH